MINKLFGNKQCFAIEIEMESAFSRFGKILLWFNGIPMGTWDEEAMIGVPIYSLSHIEECFSDVFESRTAEEIYSSIKLENNVEYGVFYKSLGDTFDDFSIAAYLSKGKVFFVWVLNDEPFFEYKNYPKEVVMVAVPLQEYQKVIFECKEFLGLNKDQTTVFH